MLPAQPDLQRCGLSPTLSVSVPPYGVYRGVVFAPAITCLVSLVKLHELFSGGRWHASTHIPAHLPEVLCFLQEAHLRGRLGGCGAVCSREQGPRPQQQQQRQRQWQRQRHCERARWRSRPAPWGTRTLRTMAHAASGSYALPHTELYIVST